MDAAGNRADPWTRDRSELLRRVTRATAIYTIEQTAFYRDNLSRAMRRAMEAGLTREQVIALSVLPREEAELMLG